MAKIQVYRVPGCSDIPVPRPATEYSAGVDLCAAVESELTVESGGTALIPTGIRVAVPRGFEWQIRPRSGLALKHGITVLNSPGTIDSDYRGPVGVILINHGTQSFTVRRGDRIAQAVLARVESVEMEVVAELSETERGEGGFGHTGI